MARLLSPPALKETARGACSNVIRAMEVANMECTITIDAPRDKPATVKRQTFSIILGCHRLQDCTAAEVLAMALNGCGYSRRGDEFTLFSSAAFEQLESS